MKSKLWAMLLAVVSAVNIAWPLQKPQESKSQEFDVSSSCEDRENPECDQPENGSVGTPVGSLLHLGAYDARFVKLPDVVYIEKQNKANEIR